MLFNQEMKAIVESLLFITNTPLSPADLAELTGFSQAEINEVLEILMRESRAADRGIEVVQLAGGYIYATKAAYKEYIEKMYKPQVSSLSAAALETLAIVAYKQPVTKGEVELLRGVNVDGAMNTLQNKGLVEEKGRKEVIGRPILYGTTKQFFAVFRAEYFGGSAEKRRGRKVFCRNYF